MAGEAAAHCLPLLCGGGVTWPPCPVRPRGNRNNHFNTLLRRGGGLFILVTDQGYQYEPGIVWEGLDSIEGDTQLLTAALEPFRPHAAAAPGAPAAAAGDAELAAALAAEEERRSRGAAAAPAEWQGACGAGRMTAFGRL